MGIKKWILPEQEPEQILQLSRDTGLPELVCGVLAARGYLTQKAVEDMTGASGQLLNDPCTLIDMDKAVERIRQALEQGEKIAVYGDYDCDGITSTALMTSYLQSVGADVFYYIPSREKEGYGMNKGAVEVIHKQGATLIITVDNGISAHEEIAYANSLGIDTVITDHHTPRSTLPEAVAIVNPHRSDCPSTFKHLAGVGVAFKMICAIEEDNGEELMEYYADIVMLGTIADVVSLTGENRLLVRHGLGLLEECQRPGLSALIDVSGLSGGAIGSEAVAFGLIPRLNAAGRMDCVDDAVELLLTDDVPYAIELAETINAQNERRKQIEAGILTEIESILAANPQILAQRVIVVSGKGWHHGVVGIAAAKIMEKYGKPVILFSIDGGEARGSGRSIEGFSLIDAITACCEHLTQFGGHTLAAGLTVPADLLEAFNSQLQAYVAENYHTMPVASHLVDGILMPGQMTVDSIKALDLLEPFGQGNRPPLFLLQNHLIDGIYPTADKKHIRLRLNGGGESFYAVYFRMSEEAFPYRAGDRVDVLASISVGQYNGKPQISVKVKDLRLAGIPQDEVLQGREWYACYQDGQPACPLAELLPQREDFAVVYRYLRTAGGFRHGAEELYYRLHTSGIGYAKMRVALDVLEEMELIARSGTGQEADMRLLPAKGKVDMEQSKILISLRV